ncbi:MAG: hypothetical protein ACLQU5_30945 [Isosphaeraceae bacterium]
MIIQHGEPPDGDAKDLSEFFKPIFEPSFAVKQPLTAPSGNARLTQRLVR